MQWMYDTYVTQDDEAKYCTDAHFACYHHAADWEAFLCTLVARDIVRNKRRGHQHSSACVDNTRLSCE